MFIKVFASGTNVQRLAKSAKKADGVLYTAYSELENTEENIVRRKFYAANLEQLKSVVESQNEQVQPSWTKIWGKPNSNKTFIASLFKSFVGEESLIPTLNLNQITSESISCFMVLVSANKKEMSQINKIINKNLPDYETVILNGDFTTNKKAEAETEEAIARAKMNNKLGVIILANQMGSRSYSIGEIQATIMAYDRGSVDASQQKVSRCLTPGDTYDEDIKEHGHIVDLSFDPNRSENIERLLVDEIIQVQRSQDTDFPTATSFVLNSIDLSRVNEYGYTQEITEEEMFGILGDNDNLLSVADITVDTKAIFENNLFDLLQDVVVTSESKSRKTVVGENVVNKIKVDEQERLPNNKKDPEVKRAEDIINSAIKSINNSATSVFFMSNFEGNTYRECLHAVKDTEDFKTVIGVYPSEVINLLECGVLNEPILDVVVQNSKTISSEW